MAGTTTTLRHRRPRNAEREQAATGGPGDAIDLALTNPRLVAYGAGEGDFPSDQPGLATGDFNGDGLDDFAAGARFADSAAGADAGAAYVVVGREDLPATVDFANGEEDVLISGPGAGANLGFSAAAEDLNRDGQDDLVLGAPLRLSPGNVRDPRTSSSGRRVWRRRSRRQPSRRDSDRGG